jgi:hypothetical protein
MNDREFLEYVWTHSRSERALFHQDQIERLFKLARVHPIWSTYDWTAMHESTAHPLVERARTILDRQASALNHKAATIHPDPLLSEHLRTVDAALLELHDYV